MKILSVVGARPNFMKIAPIITAVDEYNFKFGDKASNGNAARIVHKLLHTGQHYDQLMSALFFKDLKLPKPDIYLGVGSASHAVQTADIMNRFEPVLLSEEPDVVLVAGDVNSTISCAIVASKISYGAKRPLIAHVESGLRSFDRTMPEEINRIVTDHVSDILFVTEESGVKNLKKEGIAGEKVYFVGNTMIDTLLKFKKQAGLSDILKSLGLAEKGKKAPYALLTLHRPSNVDTRENLENIIEALQTLSNEMPIIFPAHPRTKARIEEFGFKRYFNFLPARGPSTACLKRINAIDAQGYIDFLCLLKNSRIVLTDSGGVQEETTCLGVPCVTLRENTERPVTVEKGTNIIAGTDKDKIIKAIDSQLGKRSGKKPPPKWDGRSAARIIQILAKKNHERSSSLVS
ncbi:MAG: UDP-N-acetylglucosamine 2-epimerase (non-hydrolyzing) [Deltaproteobacteria bacterium]|nr:UDP-N-acetylglucosamine 2-epimerase (non-hydrolyzing) [Deltaproteobacteria bacterium]